MAVNDLGGMVDGDGGSPDTARAVVDEITATGGEAAASHDSMTGRDGARRIRNEAVSRFGSVDILVNNAAILRDGTFAGS